VSASQLCRRRWREAKRYAFEFGRLATIKMMRSRWGFSYPEAASLADDIRTCRQFRTACRNWQVAAQRSPEALALKDV